MAAPFVPRLRLYQQWLAEHRNLHFDSFDALWRWSTSDLSAFWQSIWDYFEMASPTPLSAVLSGGPMPHVKWFEGAQVNYARQVMRHVAPAHAAGMLAIVSEDETGRVREMTYDNAEDYLVRAQEAANSYDNEGRKEGLRQFLDEKTYKPGLGAYDLSRRKDA